MVDANCQEKVDLFISARDLPSMQTFSATDPFAVIFMTDPKTKADRKIATSELIKNTENPDWPMAYTVDYQFEVIQEVKIKLYQHNGSTSSNDESKHKLIGQGTFFLSNLMCAQSNSLTIPLTSTKGNIIVRGEAKHNTRDMLCVTFSALKLSNKEGWFSKSDPFLNIARINEDGTWTYIWKSTTIENSLNPMWNATKIPMSTLCNGDIDRPLKIDILDWEKNGKHNFMGTVQTSCRALLTNNGAGMDVIEPDKKAKKKNYINSGTLLASNVIVEYHPTFTEFIAGGCEISLVVAIDFTASNGDPANPSSLHFINHTGAYNAYQSAIAAVGSVLKPYDTDNMYPVYGFGAKIRQGDGTFSAVQHCFPVYGGGVEVQGVEGLLQAYKDCLQNVLLSGPTLFSPLVNASSQIAASNNCRQDKQKYDILLILTDGVINDMDATINSIIGASDQPLSIIIIGIGEADFSGMTALDSDHELLKSGSNVAKRDIVQFVAYRDVCQSPPSELASLVLAEVPGQLLKYMESRGIKPTPAVPQSLRAVS